MYDPTPGENTAAWRAWLHEQTRRPDTTREDIERAAPAASNLAPAREPQWLTTNRPAAVPDSPAFRTDGNGDYISRSIGPTDLSPIHLIATAARRLIHAGHDLPLPDDFDTDMLDQIARTTGEYGTDVRVTARQARELVEIGARLPEADLEPREINALVWLAAFIGYGP